MNRPWVGLLVVAAASAGFLLQAHLRSRNAAPTFDEVAHVAAAYDAIHNGRYRLNREHPPLTKQLAGLGLDRLELEFPDVTPPPGAGAAAGYRLQAGYWFQAQWAAGRALLLGQPVLGPMQVIAAGRWPLLPLILPLIAGLARWLRSLASPGAAAIAVGLVAFSPNLIAHARLIHNDFAVAVLMTLALAQAYHLRRRPAAVRAVGLGFLIGLALLAKHSALLLGPMLLAIAIAETSLAEDRRAVARAWLRDGSIGLIVTVVVVAFSTLRFDPGAFLQGLAGFAGDERQGYQVYCAGRFAERFLGYFPMALLVKLPIGCLALLACAVPALRQMERLQRRAVLCWLVLPAAVFLALAMTLSYQIGIRYLLPLLPLLMALGGIGGAWLWSRGWRGRGLLLLALIGHGVEASVPRSDPITFFNVAAGGPRAGYRWLDDSNVDWGQDLPALVAWHRDQLGAVPAARIAVGHFGSIPPEMWPGSTIPADPIALEWRLLLPDFDRLAISPHLLVRQRLAQARLTPTPLPWHEPSWIAARIADVYLVYVLRPATDGSGYLVIASASPQTIAKSIWLGDARRRLGDARQALAGADAAAQIQLMWQAARFFERWDPGGVDGAAARRAVDDLVRSLGSGATRAQPPALRREMRDFWETRRDWQRADAWN